MLNRIREVRRSRGLTLDDVAARCEPPTTPQTIGRLETGMRTISIGWLDRIARAIDVEPEDLIVSAERRAVEVVAEVGGDGAIAPKRSRSLVPPSTLEGFVGVQVVASVGDYRAGDELWCELLEPTSYARALNRDVLVPRAGGRFLFGRLINRDEHKLQILPLEPGGRQHVASSPDWLAVAAKLVRRL